MYLPKGFMMACWLTVVMRLRESSAMPVARWE